MATQKIFQRVFSDFKGLNLNSNVLIRQPNEAVDMVNLEVADDFSLRLREGARLLGQPVRSMGIANYVVGGNEQLVCYGIEQRHINRGTYTPHLYRLVSANLTITRTAGSTSWNAYCFIDSDFGQWRFQISQGGAIYYTQLLGTGLETSPYLLHQLADAIGATANFDAVVDWSWFTLGSGSGLSVPVATNPHPFPELRAVFFPNVSSGTGWRYLRSITAGPNLNVEGNGPESVSWAIGQWHGLASLPAATIIPRSPEIGEQSALSVLAIPFSYWEPIPSHNLDTTYQKIIPSGVLTGGIIPNDYGLVDFAQLRNVLYFSGGQGVGAVTSSTPTAQYTLSNLGTPTPVTVRRGVSKYDGRFAYMTSAYYEPSIDTAAHNAGFPATWTLGSQYKYRCLIRQRDAQGNEIVAASTAVLPFTIANAIQGVQLTLRTRDAVDQRAGIIRSSVFTSSGSTSSAITLSGATNSAIFRVGDRVSILGPDPGLGARWSSRFGTVTAWSGSAGTVTVTMDTGNYTTVPSGARTVSSFIAADETVVEIYRTKANQNIFFLVGQVPLYYDTAAPTTTFIDDVTDANLGRVYDGPVDDFGNPTVNLCMGVATSLEAHQGVIAHVGETGNVRWDDGDFIERWIPARAEIEVASSTPGAVTGLISDQNSQLIATKPDSIIAITGSLPENQANTNVLVENFRGASASAAVAPVLGMIWGAGRNGPFSIAQGQVQVEFANRVQAAFSRGSGFKIGGETAPTIPIIGLNSNLDFSKINVSIDSNRHRLFITARDLDYSFVYDYLYNIWSTFTGYIPHHGGASFNRNFAFGSRTSVASTSGAVFVRENVFGSDFYRYFNDNGLGIEARLTLGFDDLDTPNVAKEFQWLRFYFAPVEAPNFITSPSTSYYNSTPLLKTFKNYRFDQASTVLQDTYPGDSDDWQVQSKVYRLRSELLNSMAISLYIEGTSNINKPFILSAYDMMVSPSTTPDSISR